MFFFSLKLSLDFGEETGQFPFALNTPRKGAKGKFKDKRVGRGSKENICSGSRSQVTNDCVPSDQQTAAHLLDDAEHKTNLEIGGAKFKKGQRNC